MDELVSILVLDLGLPYNYVMDEMKPYEVNFLTKYRHYKHKDDYELTRYIVYTLCQLLSKKELEMTDLIRYPWDELNEESKEDTISNVERLMKVARQFSKEEGK